MTRTLLVLLVSLSAAVSVYAGERTPNVVVILADDLGYMDIGANNPNTFYETPHIDRLAKRGMRFTDGYAACPVCSPTRASLMTGKYPPRTGITDFIPGGRNGKLIRAPNADHLALEEVTIAERFRDAGYATFFAGKWHLGGKDHSPSAQGFPADLVAEQNAQKMQMFWYPKSEVPPPDPKDDPKSSYRIANEAVRFIHAQRGRPFFAYLPFLAPHTPVKAREDLIAKYEKKKQSAPADAWGKERGNDVRLVQNHAAYGAMIEQLDSAIGRVLDAITQNGLDENTIIVFTSDNGGLALASERPTANAPLRAGKGWAYEGGLRVPWIIVAPRVAAPASTSNTPIISNDLFPTLLELTGQPLNPRQHQDGISLVPVLKGGTIPSRPLFWHYPHYGAQHGAPFGAVRAGEWKLIEWYEDGATELYRLSDDIGEKQNLAAANPDKVKELHQQLIQWRKSVNAVMPTPNPDWKNASPKKAESSDRPAVMFNYDGGYFWFYPRSPMTTAGAAQLVEAYQGTPATHLMLCTGGQMLSYESKRFCKISDITEEQLQQSKTERKIPWADTELPVRVRNHQLLAKRGVDSFRVWIKRARELGISPWLSRRMNDLHFVEAHDYPIHSKFWRQKEHWADPTGRSWRKYLDYGQAEVRQWSLDVIEEHLERYLPDGLELDFVRGPFYFRDDQCEQGLELMTGFIRQVRERTQYWSEKRGRKIALGVRVGTRPELLVRMGLDPARWAREGLIDQLVLSPFNPSSDTDVPIEEWTRRMGADARARIRLAVAMDANLQAYEQKMAGNYQKTFVHGDLAAKIGFTAAMLHRGADGTYWMNHEAPPKFERYAGKEVPYRDFVCRIGQSLDGLCQQPRRIVVTYPDIYPPGEKPPQQLPCTVTAAQAASVKLYVGPAPRKGDTVEVHALVVDQSQLRLCINGHNCSGQPSKYRDNALQVGTPISFAVPADAVKPGANILEFQLAATDQPATKLIWVEMNIVPAGSSK